MVDFTFWFWDQAVQNFQNCTFWQIFPTVMCDMRNIGIASWCPTERLEFLFKIFESFCQTFALFKYLSSKPPSSLYRYTFISLRA